MAKKPRLKAENATVVTPEFQASYPALFEAKKMEGATKSYFSVQALFQTKETPESKAANRPVVDIEPLKTLVRNVMLEKFGADKTKWPKFGDGSAGTVKLPFRSGEEAGKKDKKGYGAGITFVEFKKPGDQVRPGIVGPTAGPDGKPVLITIPSDVYGGCFMRAKVNPYWWEVGGKQGISFGLQSAQKLRDGEPFGGGSDAQADFDACPTPAAEDGLTPVPAGAAPAPVAAASDLGV